MTATRADSHPVRRDGVLHVEGVALDTLAARYGTPCYVYSLPRVERAYRAYADALGSRGRVCYAVKANPTRAILAALARQGAGFDIVSAGEMQRVLAAGGEPARIVFSGVGKTDEEMRAALAARVGCFNIESPSELHRLDKLACDAGTRVRAALRVNPDVEAATHRHIATGSERHKFGIAQPAAAALALEARHLQGVELEGLAMHIGSQIVDPAPILAATQQLVALARDLRSHGVALRHLDLGGGLGVGPGAPVIADYVKALCAAAGDEFEIMLEPGRSIVAESGLLLTRVVCIKHHAQRSFAVVDAGMNDFLRPALYDAWHDIVLVDERDRAPTATYDVVGPVCESADTLGRARRLAVREGSLVALLQAGAYGATMASHYNSRPLCAEVVVADGAATLARERETVAGIMRNEHEA